MTPRDIILGAESVPAFPWPRHVLTPPAWRVLAEGLATEPALSLQALWADTIQVHALFQQESTGEILAASVPVEDGAYPALSPQRPAAAWFERMVHDLWGHVAAGGQDLRPWLDHGRWENHRPMSPRPVPAAAAPEPPAFLPVEGEDLHQVPLGPVQAGIAEPRHIRLTAAGETIVRTEARLGYAHKGILVLMRGKSPRAAARFAARLAGDATVAHGIAFARAAEAASGVAAPPRAHALRGVMAELERIAIHLGDLGAIHDAAGCSVSVARFGWQREAVLRAAAVAFGHRLMMDCVTPGGVAADIAASGIAAIRAALDRLDAELPDLLRAHDKASLADRLIGTGVVAPALASLLGAGGPIGRAAGRDVDARRAPGYPPYDGLAVRVPVLPDGDVDARMRVRLVEIGESIRLLRVLLADLPDGAVSEPLPATSGEGFGVAEGPRGDVWHWLRLDAGLIAAAFARDPGWLQWPLLEAAASGGIVADFPLIDSSFNCGCSGMDL